MHRLALITVVTDAILFLVIDFDRSGLADGNRFYGFVVMQPKARFGHDTTRKSVAQDTALLLVGKSQSVPKKETLKLAVRLFHARQHPRNPLRGSVTSRHVFFKGRAPSETEVSDRPAFFFGPRDPARFSIMRKPLPEDDVRHHPALGNCERQKRDDRVDPTGQRFKMGVHSLKIAFAEREKNFGDQIMFEPSIVGFIDSLMNAFLVGVAEINNLVLPPVGSQDPYGLGAIDLVTTGARGSNTVERVVSTGQSALVAERSVIPGLEKALVDLLALVPTKGGRQILHFFEFVEKDDTFSPLAFTEPGRELPVTAVFSVPRTPEAASEEIGIVPDRLTRDKQKVFISNERLCRVSRKISLPVTRWTEKKEDKWFTIRLSITKMTR